MEKADGNRVAGYYFGKKRSSSVLRKKYLPHNVMI